MSERKGTTEKNKSPVLGAGSRRISKGQGGDGWGGGTSMLYGPGGGSQRGRRWKERGKTATSTRIEGTRYISPNRAR